MPCFCSCGHGLGSLESDWCGRALVFLFVAVSHLPFIVCLGCRPWDVASRRKRRPTGWTSSALLVRLPATWNILLRGLEASGAACTCCLARLTRALGMRGASDRQAPRYPSLALARVCHLVACLPVSPAHLICRLPSQCLQLPCWYPMLALVSTLSV